MEKQEIIIPPIILEWSEWFPWKKFLIHGKHPLGLKIPNKPGVYEAKYNNSEERLTIGKASNLRSRIKQGLVKGNSPHSTGERIRMAKEDTSRIVIRWAETDRPAAVEEELCYQYYEKFNNNLPKYARNFKYIKRP